jgi:hypothetical protein
VKIVKIEISELSLSVKPDKYAIKIITEPECLTASFYSETKPTIVDHTQH